MAVATSQYTPAQRAIIEGKLTNVLKTRTDAQPAAQLAAAIPAPHEDDTRYTYTPAEDEPSDLEIQMGESIAQIEEQKARRGMLAAFQEIEQRYRKIAYHPTFGAILGRYSVQQPEQFSDIEEARACHREMRYDLEKREKAYARCEVTRLTRYLRYAILGLTQHPRTPIKRRVSYRGPARDWKYRLWIRSQPSLVSGCWPCEAAHTGSDGGTALKASDYSCVPLIWREHRELHRIGRVSFEKKYGVDFGEQVRRLNAEFYAGGE